MTFAFAVAHLHLPAARSLKEKRRVVKSLVDRIHHRFRVSIAETDFHDLHQRAEIGIAAVHRNDHELQRMLDEIHRLIDTVPEATLTDWQPELFEAVS